AQHVRPRVGDVKQRILLSGIAGGDHELAHGQPHAACQAHPDLPALRSRGQSPYSFLADSEMRRLNIEGSDALWRLAQVRRERGAVGWLGLLAKAYGSLPRAHQAVRNDRQQERFLVAALQAGQHNLARAVTAGEAPAARREAEAVLAAVRSGVPPAPRAP